MHRKARHLVGGAMLAVMVLAATAFSAQNSSPNSPAADQAPPINQNLSELAALTIEYPLDGSVFPPEIVAPNFRWKDENADCDSWLVTIEFDDDKEEARFVVRDNRWSPSSGDWEKIKKRSKEKSARVTIIGFDSESPEKVISGARIGIKTSPDKVGAPIFYREVNLPFVDAVKDPTTIRWRFGDISCESAPPVVLDNLPVCGNCHSFSAKGDVLGMDIDYANNKGSYAIEPVEQHMVLDKDGIITWSDYKRDQNEVTYGLLSQVSPDGRYVVSTVKDESVFVPKPGLDFSQLFFPVKGVLCVYDREKGTFEALPGADDPYLVQSNPTWSPDGEYIVFAATEAYKLKRKGPRKLLLSGEECWEFLEEGKPFKFDLYRIPFNGGKGGEAEPLEGASFNGKSNYFARYSPDGKWIVFCQAENYMLL
ncbi:MAG: TolB family protein, partial [Planctomycetota bacterium]